MTSQTEREFELLANAIGLSVALHRPAPGELRELRRAWGDIDWMRRVVFVRRSYTVDADGPTKSGKVRSVPLVDQAARALDELSRRERWTSDEDRVFVNDVGEHIEDSALRRRFYRALEAAGLPPIRFHDLAPHLRDDRRAGFPAHRREGVHGPRDIQTTMIYIHHVPQHDAAERLSKLLERANSGCIWVHAGCTRGVRRRGRGRGKPPLSRGFLMPEAGLEPATRGL